MKFIAILALALFASAVSASVVELAGTKPEGTACTSANECVQPFYCLPDGDAYSCLKKDCSAQNQCHIGQYCDLKAGKCAVKSCTKSSECAGDTVCQVNGKCGAKGSIGQECSSADQCWSGECKDEKCSDGDNIVEDVVDGAGDVVDGVADGATGAVDGAMNLGKRIGGGGIVGIILGILFVIALIAACCYFCLFAKRKLTNRDGN